uniref:Uncharacterized protein n=2 Tax=Chenopodium quinoa TaxID=63459 RepID=A0A803MA11_CHEQI
MTSKLSFPHSSHTPLLTLIFTLLIFLLSSTLPLSSSITPPKNQSPSTRKPFSKIYAFGDSYTDTGNTISATGPSGFNFVSNLPYGMTYFHHPTNRYSDGRLVIDFVTQTLSLPFLPAYRSTTSGGATNGVNFAVAGSTAIEHAFFVKNNLTFDVTPESLGTQLGWFNKYLAKQGGCNDPVKCGALFNDALFWVGEIGANDYAYAAETEVSKSVIRNLAITRVSNFLEAILRKGAKYVVVQGLPPTGCLTLAMYLAPTNDRDDLGCVKSVNTQSNTHNTLLQAKIQDLRKKYPKSNIIYADYYNAYRDIMKNSKKYGFKEAFKVCCGSGGGSYNYEFFSVCGSPSAKPCPNPSQYMNWDGVHLTEAMNKVVSGLLLQGGYSHPSFQDLISKKMSQL